MNTSSRRSFLKTSVAGAVFSSSGILAATVSAQTKKWDETFDVIVVGSGFAGLAAAIEAKKAGANVIVLEKSLTEEFLQPPAVRSKRNTTLKIQRSSLRKIFSWPATI